MEITDKIEYLEKVKDVLGCAEEKVIYRRQLNICCPIVYGGIGKTTVTQ